MAVWLGDGEMAPEYGGRTLSRHGVPCPRDPKLAAVANPRPFSAPYGTGQPKPFAPDALGEGGRLRALRLAGYSARSRRSPDALQHALFPYAGAP